VVKRKEIEPPRHEDTKKNTKKKHLG
jgi:hypothetical protein